MFVKSKHEQHNTMGKSLELPEVRANELMQKYIIKFPVITLEAKNINVKSNIWGARIVLNLLEFTYNDNR